MGTFTCCNLGCTRIIETKRDRHIYIEDIQAVRFEGGGRFTAPLERKARDQKQAYLCSYHCALNWLANRDQALKRIEISYI